jgi:ATP:cob(I)alamin adenosyltransferase
LNVFTRRGDAGKTSLYGGTEVFKDDNRVWCYGTIDEADSALAIVYASLQVGDLKSRVRDIQKKLFVVSAELASDDKQREKNSVVISDDDVKGLEKLINDYTDEFGKIIGFSMPGETKISSLFHLARTIVRRAERHVVTLSRDEYVSPVLLQYFNRLSDALFVMAKMEVYQNFVESVVEKLKGLVTMEGGGTMFTAELCDRLRNAAGSESARIGAPVSLAIVDEGGNLVYFYRFPGAALVSVEVARNKAYTAVAMKRPSGDLYSDALPGGSLHGINTVDPKIVVFGGGFPLFVNGALVGGIGISGGMVPEDEQIGRRVVAEFENGGEHGSDIGRY